jgi:hypothetical protein
MEGQSLQEALFKLGQRLTAVEQEVKIARDDFQSIYNRIAGKEPTSGPGTLMATAAEDRLASVGLNAVAQGASTLPSTLYLHERRSSIRTRLREFVRHNSGRCLSAAAIAGALGTKKSSTRFELYQLQKERVVVKCGVDQWQFCDSGRAEKQAVEQTADDAPLEPADGKAAIVDSGTSAAASTVQNTVDAPSKPRAEISGTSAVTKPEIAEEEVTLSDAAITSEWYSTRERILQYLRENSSVVFTSGQIAVKLKINRSLAREALSTLKDEHLIESLGSDLWKYIKLPEEKN